MCSALRSKLMDRRTCFGREYLKLLLKEVRVKDGKVQVRGGNKGIIHALKTEELGTHKMTPGMLECFIL